MYSDLNVSGNVYLYSNLDISKNINIDGDINISGDTFINNNMYISGITILKNTLQLLSLSSFERDNLTGLSDGDIIYNNTTNNINIYKNGNWYDNINKQSDGPLIINDN